MKKRKKEKRVPVLLLDDLPNLGQRGQVVLVKPGYYRYLLSQQKALLATEEKLETELKPFILEEKIRSREEETIKLKEEIEKLELEFKIKIGKKDEVFSPVTKEKIAKALKEKGFEIPKGQIDLKGKLEKDGEYEISINLGYNLVARLKIKIITEKL